MKKKCDLEKTIKDFAMHCHETFESMLKEAFDLGRLTEAHDLCDECPTPVKKKKASKKK
jgi:hypothetical protein